MTQAVTIDLKTLMGVGAADTDIRIELIGKRHLKPAFIRGSDNLIVGRPIDLTTDSDGTVTVDLESNTGTIPDSCYRLTVAGFSDNLDFEVGSTDADLIDLLI